MLNDSFGPSLRYFATFNARMQAGLITATKRNLALVERTVKSHLRNQDLGWKALSPAYVKRKARAGVHGGGRRSEKKLIATGTYLRSITSQMTGVHEGTVGVLRSSRYADGERIANIAEVHEFGSPVRNIPARPLWAPSAEETDDECRRNWITAARNTVISG